MRTLKQLVVLLLIVALPVYAWAGLDLPAVCAMQSTPAAGLTGSGPPCCSRADTAADDAQAQSGDPLRCKAGQQCKTVNIHLLLPAGTPLPDAPSGDGIAVATASRVPSGDPAGPWRPPRLS
ncbi:MAG TPA: hypothetical protein PL143_02470 [Rhodocyclaceae bacterium]|nr:hypothetical protein [Rhodocyclaceae bacterium]